MGNTSMWVRVPINTYNRDRRGGHQATIVTDSMGWQEYMSPAGARFQKRKTRREQRREHNKITREALRSHHNTTLEDERDQRELDHQMWLAEMEMEAEWLQDEYDYNHPLDYHNDDPEPYDPMEDYFYYDDYTDGDEYLHPNPSSYYVAGHLSKIGLTRMEMNARISIEDAGKTLGDILQEALERRG